MSTDDKLIIAELTKLSRDCAVMMKYIADLSRTNIISATPGMIEKLIQARRLVDEACEEFLEYQKTIGGVR